MAQEKSHQLGSTCFWCDKELADDEGQLVVRLALDSFKHDRGETFGSMWVCAACDVDPARTKQVDNLLKTLLSINPSLIWEALFGLRERKRDDYAISGRDGSPRGEAGRPGDHPGVQDLRAGDSPSVDDAGVEVSLMRGAILCSGCGNALFWYDGDTGQIRCQRCNSALEPEGELS